MPDQNIIIVDDQGREHIFPPGMDPVRAAQAVKNTLLEEANKRPLNEPTTEWGGRVFGFMKGANDAATDLGNAAFEGAAHPKTAGDIAGLMLPTSGFGAARNLAADIPKDVPSVNEPVGNRVLKFGARRAADVLDLTPKIISSPLEERVSEGLKKVGQRRPGNMVDRFMANKPADTHVPVQAEDVSHLTQPEVTSIGEDIGPHRSPSDLRTKESISPADRYAPDTKESSLVDRFMPNEGADIHPTDRIENADLRPEVGKDPESIVDRYMPNKGGEVQPGVEQDIPAPTEGSFGEAKGPMPGEGLESVLGKVAGLDEGSPWITPDSAAELRSRVGSKEAARQLGTSPDLVKAQAPRTGPAELPSEVKSRLDAAIAAIPTMEGKIEYLNKAPNQLTKDYLSKLLGM